MPSIRKGSSTPTPDAGARLRALIGRARNPRAGAVAVPGVFSPAVGLLAEKAGFECAYFSGAAFANQMGLPDLGVTTLSEVAEAVGKVTSRISLPLIVDADTGFGEAVNVSRTIFELERAGAAAVQLEDQVMPKRCGHLDGKELVEPAEMVKKLVAARRARRTKLVVVARTDSASVRGLDDAVERARLYVRAGADVIFPEALASRAEFREFARKVVGAPLLANMTEFGKTPHIPLSEFSKMGYSLVIFPVTAFRVAMGAVREAFAELARTGTQKALLSRMMTRDEFYSLSGYRAAESLDRETEREAKRIVGTTD